jgi:hypothetical protein
MNKLKKILLSNKAKAFYWTTLNGFIVVIISGLAEIDWVYAPLLIAILNGITKYLNRDVLQRKYGG